MESFYDSDEEIAWGPMSLREIKSDFTKRPNRTDIQRRHTNLGLRTPLKEKSGIDKLVDDISRKLNIVDNSSTFYKTILDDIENSEVITDDESDDFISFECKEISGISEKTIYYEHKSCNEAVTRNLTKINTTDIRRSDLQNFSIDLLESQRNLSDDSSIRFNDTFEEQGLDYKMPKHSIISASFLTNKCTADIKTPQTVFKIPSKLPTPRAKTPGKTKSKFNHIVSPIRIYINNSTTCLKKNVVGDTKITKSVLSKATKKISEKENISKPLAEVIYKPAKKTVTSSTKHIKLPSNIKKLVDGMDVTKHEKRLNRRYLKREEIAKRLQGNDLTLNEDGSMSSSSIQDVSLLTVKQDFIQ
ncbi:unnamed protein product [Brassicogethes aeneus]|uniref:Uncharacterized protein n=1 Tax=Brassicogethes aeneus TaxID=1431903 RepID=A0A9P0FE37_BRAAE|nr:unnamed protein product [Brassicogethes aeneus]